jgi:hypothetical protein
MITEKACMGSSYPEKGNKGNREEKGNADGFTG